MSAYPEAFSAGACVLLWLGRYSGAASMWLISYVMLRIETRRR